MSNQNQEKEPKYEISVTEPEEFNEVSKLNYLTSRELCQLVNPLFKAAFADFHGSTFEVSSNGVPTFNLFFNHLKYGENDIVAFSATAEAIDENNEIVRRIKSQRLYQQRGAAYDITRKGKEAIGKFVSSMYKDRNGVPNFKAITMDVAQPNSREILSKVSAIDVVDVIREVFGRKDEDGVRYDYNVQIVSSLPQINPMVGNPEYLISITKINEEQLDRALRNAGIVNANGLGIYRV